MLDHGCTLCDVKTKRGAASKLPQSREQGVLFRPKQEHESLWLRRGTGRRRRNRLRASEEGGRTSYFHLSVLEICRRSQARHLRRVVLTGHRNTPCRVAVSLPAWFRQAWGIPRFEAQQVELVLQSQWLPCSRPHLSGRPDRCQTLTAISDTSTARMKFRVSSSSTELLNKTTRF
jgi:hypothetical protein